jgi:queuosine precursor transporter
MIFKDKRTFLLFILWGFFITNAIIAEVIGVKLVDVGEGISPGIFVMSIGILPWPIVFLTTDIMNEFYGKKVVRKVSVLTAFLIGYAFVLIFSAIFIKGYTVTDAEGKVVVGVSEESFYAIFGQSMWIIVGSITAFLFSQLVDVFVFWFVRERTGGKMIWLRATGSTMVSQLVDTFIVQGIAFWLPGKWTTAFYVSAAFTSYSVKLLIALLLIPLIYLAHSLVKKYLGSQDSHDMQIHTAEESLHHKVKD